MKELNPTKVISSAHNLLRELDKNKPDQVKISEAKENLRKELEIYTTHKNYLKQRDLPVVKPEPFSEYFVQGPGGYAEKKL